MCNTATKASDISEILQKKWNMDTCFIRLRENIMNFAAGFRFKIVLRMKKITDFYQSDDEYLRGCIGVQDIPCKERLSFSEVRQPFDILSI